MMSTVLIHFRKCRCEANTYVWYEDLGTFSKKEILPIRSLHLGDTGHGSEEIKLSISPLLCTQSVKSKYYWKYNYVKCKLMLVIVHG